MTKRKPEEVEHLPDDDLSPEELAERKAIMKWRADELQRLTDEGKAPAEAWLKPGIPR